VSSEQIAAMCNETDGYAQDSIMCEESVYHNGQPQGGLLLFGSGRFYRKSALYMAWINQNEIGRVNQGRPIVHYLTRTKTLDWDWSESEDDAMYIYTSPERAENDTPYLSYNWQLDNCDSTVYWGSCFPRGGYPKDTFGEISTKLINNRVGYTGEPILVMLSNGGLFRTSRLSTPWRWTNPSEWASPYYGLYVIDRYTTYSPSNQGSLTLWHTASFWDGKDATPGRPYGVYTTNTIISPFPPNDI
jgi:hypothetical protein